MKLPSYIALCGNPEAGKSKAAELLQAFYGYTIVDDGFALRDFAIRHFGASKRDVSTQEGKASLAYWPNREPVIDQRSGEHLTWRQVLGRIGEQLEQLFGEHITGMMACARHAGGIFVFPSVRRSQAAFYRAHGGLVIGIRNPLTRSPANPFDRFDESLIDHWVENDALARGLPREHAEMDLLEKLEAVLLQARAL